MALAQELALRTDVTFTSDGLATIDSVEVTRSSTDQPSPRQLVNVVRVRAGDVVAYQTSPSVSFRLLDAPSSLPSVTHTLRIPYAGNVGVLEVLYDGALVASYDLAKLCVVDGLCEAPENELSCAADCGPRCIADNRCDASCADDPDCGGFLWLPVLGIGVLLFAIIAFWFWRRRQ